MPKENDPQTTNGGYTVGDSVKFSDLSSEKQDMIFGEHVSNVFREEIAKPADLPKKSKGDL